MDYHKNDEPLRLREYGRNVQILADKMMAETNERRRTEMAHDLVRIMATIVPNESKDMNELKKKLWDHLYRITNYELPDSIMPHKPPVPLRNVEPVRIPYDNYHSKYKPYGRNVELLIEKALSMPESYERNRFIYHIAHIMRSCLFNYSNGVTSDKVIFEHLAELSNGRIMLDADEISLRDTSRNGPLPPSLQIQGENENITPNRNSSKRRDFRHDHRNNENRNNDHRNNENRVHSKKQSQGQPNQPNRNDNNKQRNASQTSGNGNNTQNDNRRRNQTNDNNRFDNRNENRGDNRNKNNNQRNASTSTNNNTPNNNRNRNQSRNENRNNSRNDYKNENRNNYDSYNDKNEGRNFKNDPRKRY